MLTSGLGHQGQSKKQPVELTEEQKAQSEADKKRKAALAALQSKITLTRGEVQTCEALIPKIQAKGLPEEFCSYLADKLQEVTSSANKASNEWAAEWGQEPQHARGGPQQLNGGLQTGRQQSLLEPPGCQEEHLHRRAENAT